MPPVKVPWVVGRVTLLEYAADDFLHEVSRQRPWCRARYEELLSELSLFLSPYGLASLSALTEQRTEAWLGTLDSERHALAAQLMRDFREYLHEWAWLDD